MAGIFAVWAIGLTAYLCFQDEIAAVLLRRQADMQYAYETQINGLRAQIERSATLALVEREKADARLNGMVARQSQIEDRQASLTLLAERTLGPTAAKSRPGAAAPVPTADFQVTPETERIDRFSKPTPIGETSAAAPIPPRATPSAEMKLSPGDKLSWLDQALDRTATEQTRFVSTLRSMTEARLALLDDAIAATGLDPARLRNSGQPSKSSDGVGGPLVALPSAPAPGSSFDIAAGELDATIQRFGRMRQIARILPLNRPLAGSLETSSSFGYRVDPFTRGAALHTGVDLRSEYGTEVRATGPGRVTAAEASGGYGNMIEIDHGNDIVTRYAHLSVIGVVEGQSVAAGAVIGHVGSTGRSTGAHLHYETRIDGEPVDPQRFLRAGAQLASAVAR